MPRFSDAFSLHSLSRLFFRQAQIFDKAAGLIISEQYSPVVLFVLFMSVLFHWSIFRLYLLFVHTSTLIVKKMSVCNGCLYSKARSFLYYQIYCFMIKTWKANWTYPSYVLGWPKDIQTEENQFTSTTYQKYALHVKKKLWCMSNVKALFWGSFRT